MSIEKKMVKNTTTYGKNQNSTTHNPYVYNPYAAINPYNLSDAALCYHNNPIQDCVHFTPNELIQKKSSSVFHGQYGNNIRFIPLVNSFLHHSDRNVESFRENCACGATASIVTSQPSFDLDEDKNRRKRQKHSGQISRY